MTPADVRFLLSDSGRARLAEIDLSRHDHLWWATHLRKSHTPSEVNALLETVLLRERGRAKFSMADEMFFVRPALEQASHETVAAYRASRFREAGLSFIADLGCGIGGDALALAEHGRVVGFDLDETRLRMALANAEAAGIDTRFDGVLADIETLPLLAKFDALFFDPARRDDHGKRIFSVAEYRPSLSIIDKWRQTVPHAGVKISPGVDYRELPPAETAEAEFISHRGELKSCVLWYGALHGGVARRATVLPAGVRLTMADLPKTPIPIDEPNRFLYEPDPAVIRAHLVQALGAQLNAALISEEIAYLTASEAVETPFARCFEIDLWFPFQLKRLKRELRERGIGRVTVKKRGSPLDPDQLSRQLRGKGEQSAIVFLTQHKNRPIAGIGREIRVFD